jgi:hypothetical protein
MRSRQALKPCPASSFNMARLPCFAYCSTGFRPGKNQHCCRPCQTLCATRQSRARLQMRPDFPRSDDPRRGLGRTLRKHRPVDVRRRGCRLAPDPCRARCGCDSGGRRDGPVRRHALRRRHRASFQIARAGSNRCLGDGAKLLAHWRMVLPTTNPICRFMACWPIALPAPGTPEMLEESIPSTIRWCGTVPRDETASLPERHLGLHQAAEIKDLMARLDCMADHLAKTPLAELLSKISTPAAVSPEPSFPTMQPLLKNQTIAIARDAAFCFLYPANLELLERLGAQLKFFSPLAGEPLPKCDALWLPGGYPELHAAILSQRHEFLCPAHHPRHRWQAPARRMRRHDDIVRHTHRHARRNTPDGRPSPRAASSCNRASPHLVAKRQCCPRVRCAAIHFIIQKPKHRSSPSAMPAASGHWVAKPKAKPFTVAHG